MTHPTSIFLIFLKLGLSAFGGPVAHLAYFQRRFVEELRWLNPSEYASLVAMAQFLPGPSSSQVGMALGWRQGGVRGALAAWLGFTLPSAILMIGLALWQAYLPDLLHSAVLKGLRLAAVAVIAQAVWNMGRQLCPDVMRLSIMAASCSITLLLPMSWVQIGVIIMAGLLGLFFLRRIPMPSLSGEAVAPQRDAEASPWPRAPVSEPIGALYLLAFFGVLAILLVAPTLTASPWSSLVKSLYETGALVFGGGHVVLPLLQSDVVHTGMIDSKEFMAAYGSAQALPGPLFSIAAYVGAKAAMLWAQTDTTNVFALGQHMAIEYPIQHLFGPAILGGVVATVAIFTPSFFLVGAALSFWPKWQRSPSALRGLAGVNAAVVGLLLATLYHPAWTETVQEPADFCLVLIAVIALAAMRISSFYVVVGAGLIGGLLGHIEGLLTM